MFSDAVGEEVIELVMASLYHSSGALLAPASADVAFLRFLKLISTFSWKHDALVVVGPDAKAADLADVKRAFKDNRESFPAMTILTATDKTRSVFTIAGTVRVFLQRFTLEDAIGSHAGSLEVSMRVTNGIHLGCSLLLPVHTL